MPSQQPQQETRRPMPVKPADRTMADYRALNRATRRQLASKTKVMLRGSTKPIISRPAD